MKGELMATRILAGVVFIVTLITLTAAQTRKGAAKVSGGSSNAAATPVAMDADPCFPSELQNSNVKIFRVRVAAQASTGLDIHKHDYLVLSLGNSVFKVKSEFNSRSVQMAAGELQVFKGGWAQRLINTTDSPLDLVELEVESGIDPEHPECGLAAAECRDGEFGDGFTSSTLFETPKIKVGRVDLDPNGVLPKHTHIQSHVLVALADMKLSDQETGKDAENLQLKAGEVAWHEGPEEHTLTNVGEKNAPIIVVEFKE
jgi:quercetin dioxygenase-like cupin family protein/mannose-6-phosphate isomerase-like protein (cupin superfamily)